MSAVSLRAGRSGDLAAVLELWRQSGAAPTHTDDIASLEQLVTHDPTALILAEDDGRIVGTVIAGWDGWRGSIYRLVVAPSHRRQRLGHQLVAAAVERLGGAGATRLQAIVVGDDTQAMGFWTAGEWSLQVGQVRFVYG